MSYSVYYWTAGTKFVGRAFPIILLLEHAKQKYELKAWPKELPSDALPTFAPPAITTPEGVTFGQLPLCMYELGKKLGYYPENEVDQLFIKQVSLNCLDIIWLRLSSRERQSSDGWWIDVRFLDPCRCGYG